MCISLWTYMRIHVYIFIYIYVCVCVCVLISVFLSLSLSLSQYIYIYIYTHVYIYIYIYIYIYAYTYWIDITFKKWGKNYQSPFYQIWYFCSVDLKKLEVSPHIFKHPKDKFIYSLTPIPKDLLFGPHHLSDNNKANERCYLIPYNSRADTVRLLGGAVWY